jgi:hypothetical protein
MLSWEADANMLIDVHLTLASRAFHLVPLPFAEAPESLDFIDSGAIFEKEHTTA